MVLVLVGGLVVYPEFKDYSLVNAWVFRVILTGKVQVWLSV